jgi:hypothetical protein
MNMVIRIRILHVQYLQMKLHFNFFVTLFVVGQKIQIMNLNIYLKIVKKFMCEVREVDNEEEQYSLTIYSSVLEQFRQKWRLQPDNDPKHTSNITKQIINDDVP